MVIGAVALYCTLPRSFRRILVILPGSIWYISSCTSGQLNDFSNEYANDLFKGTSAHYGSKESASYLKLKQVKKAIDDFGTNNRQRFKRNANNKTFRTIFHRPHQSDLRIQLAFNYYSFHNLVNKDLYFTILTRLTE